MLLLQIVQKRKKQKPKAEIKKGYGGVMKQKFIKWVMPKNGAMPYILVELSHKNEKKIIRVDSYRAWLEHRKELFDFAKENWQDLRRFEEKVI